MNLPNVADSLEELLKINSNSEKPDKETNIESNIKHNKDENQHQKEISPLNTIKIKQSALEKIFLLAQSVECIFGRPLEVYCICTGEKDVITDILIPEQNITYVSINIQPEHILALAPEIRANNLQVLGWAHSHANFGVFFSGTDDYNQSTLLNDTTNYLEREGTKIKFVYGMTVNTHKNLYGIVTTQYYSGKVQHIKADFEIIEDITPEWNPEKIKTEIIEKVRQKAHYSSNYYPFVNNDDEKQDKNEDNPITPSHTN